MGISVKNIVRARLEEMGLTAQRRGAILVTGQKGLGNTALHRCSPTDSFVKK